MVYLVGGWFPNPFEKYAQVKLDHFHRGENKKCLKPPPKVYICDMDITCCLPNLAFHTPMLALLYFCRVHSSKMNANHVDSRKS